MQGYTVKQKFQYHLLSRMILSDNNFVSSNSDSTKANPFNFMLSEDIVVRNVDNRAKFFSSSEPSSQLILLNSA